MKKRKNYLLGMCAVLLLLFVGHRVNATEKDMTDKIQILTREEILCAQKQDYKKGTSVKWEKYRGSKSGTHDGIIPIELLEDNIYCSMNLPSESKSDEMIRMYRDNGMFMNSLTEKQKTLIGIGAIYKTTEKKLPKKFTLCLGKIKTFVYMKDIRKWVLLDEQPYPAGVYLYKMPWTEHSRKECNNIKYYSDHIEIELTSDEFAGYALHFWGKSKKIEQENILYVACAYDFWVKESKNDDIFTATIGIDAKDEKGSKESIVQLFYSRGLAVTSEKKTHWGQTIPNDIYDPLYDGYILDVLYDKWWDVSK